jgi:hypothetical protein
MGHSTVGDNADTHGIPVSKLTVDEIGAIVKATPEQQVFDWKRSSARPRDEDGKGEFVKDLMAVANGTAFSRSTGYVFYGVNPDTPDIVTGMGERWDDNEAQALARSALDHVPKFLYYEVGAGGGRWIGVLHIEWAGGFFVVKRDIGKLRAGQCLIRKGSETRPVLRADHVELYLTPGYGWADQLLNHYGAQARLLNAHAAYSRAYQAEMADLERQMRQAAGLD